AAPKGCTAGSGRGPLEKGPRSGNLASGLPVLTHGAVPGRDALLRLVRADGRLRIEVTDTRGERHPAPTAAVDDAETGRGLLIVDTLAETWGVTPRTGAPGKTVWAVLPLDCP
ncbi:ATP-binding protein, partial [Streptomyces sp. NPDC007095]|uniref:ATP-binding protein n=1 Tax=Streptomyces sp. NPDC007095 TaxID=3154482 RepID=UPI0033E0438E